MRLEIGDRLFSVCSDLFGYATYGGESLDEWHLGKGCVAIDLHLSIGQRAIHLEAIKEVVIEILCQLHEILVVVIGPVELNRGKLRVVCLIHPFVTEVSVDLKDRLHTADNKAFEIELRCDTEISVYTQCVVVGDKGFGIGTTGDGMHHGCLYLQEASILEKSSYQGDDTTTLLKVALDLWVHDHIQIALAVTDLLVCQSVKFLWQRRDGFGDDTHLLAVQGQLTCLRDKGVASDLDDVAYLKELFDDAVVVAFRQLITRIVYLRKTIAVFDLGKSCLAHDTDKFDTAGKCHCDAVVFLLFCLLLGYIRKLL